MSNAICQSVCSGPAAKQGKSPRREFERQMKVFGHSIYTEPEHRNIQKRGVWDVDPRGAEIGADAELNLVKPATDACAVGYRMLEMAGLRAEAFGDETRLFAKQNQSHRQTSGGHTVRDVDGVDGNAAGVFWASLALRILHRGRLTFGRFFTCPQLSASVRGLQQRSFGAPV